MSEFERHGTLTVPLQETGIVDSLIAAGVGSTADTLNTIREFQERYRYLLDPHTAVGVHVGRELGSDDCPVICLSTAHPAKFSKAILEATGQDLAHHEILDCLDDAETRCVIRPAKEAVIRDFIAEHAAENS